MARDLISFGLSLAVVLYVIWIQSDTRRDKIRNYSLVALFFFLFWTDQLYNDAFLTNLIFIYPTKFLVELMIFLMNFVMENWILVGAIELVIFLIWISRMENPKEIVE